MKLFLSKPRGFCAGVIRAINTVEEALKLYGAPIYVKHQIVHNAHVVQRLEKLGAIFVDDIALVPNGERVIYSAHGIPPQVRALAKEKGLREIDATCGLVTRVHSAAKRFASKGYHIILIGHKKHVEVIGTAGEVPDQCTIVESIEDVEALSFSKEQKLFYLTQTTLSLDDVKETTAALTKKFPHIETLPSSSICYATTNRQLALREITGAVELVLVVGDPTSSNSNRLVEVAKNRGIPAYLINGADEIQTKWLKGVAAIGMTAGASTPEDVVQECINTLQEFGVLETEEVELIQENVFFQLPQEVLS